MRPILIAALASLAPTAVIAGPAAPAAWQSFETICRARGDASPAEVAARLVAAGWIRVEAGPDLAQAADLYGSMWTLQDFRITPATAPAATLARTRTEMRARFRAMVARGATGGGATGGGDSGLGLVTLATPTFRAYATYTPAAKHAVLEQFPCDVQVLGTARFLADRFDDPEWKVFHSPDAEIAARRGAATLESVSRNLALPANGAAAGLTLPDYTVSIAPVPRAGS